MNELHRTAVELRILLALLTRVGGRALEQRLQAYGVPISGLQYGILRLLSHQRYTISELSRKMALAPATLVPSVDGLERHCLVSRCHDPRDRRRTPLELTEPGATLLAEVPSVDDRDSLVLGLAAMGADKRLELLALVRELLDGMPESGNIAAEVSATIALLADAGGDAALGCVP